ncbi:MAG TPA: GGDEF domain-containing protein, partial [Gammaproteobacteria bacterium]|nr:GGDEF domain-containing protein [Gammaproteobacteria bacterium]
MNPFRTPPVRHSMLRQVVLLFLFVSILGFSLAAGAFLYFRDRVIDYAVSQHMEEVAHTTFNTFYQVMRRGWNEQVIHDLVDSVNAMDSSLSVDLYRGPMVAAQYGPDPIDHRADAQVRKALGGTPVTRIDLSGDQGRFVFPVRARKECLTCHRNVMPGDIQGVLDVHYCFAGLAGVLEQAVLWSGGAVAAILALMLGALYWGFRRTAVVPLRRLKREVLGAGQQGSVLARVPPETATSRELDQLVGAFNAVMQRLQSATVSKEVIDAEARVLRSLAENADRILDREAFARGLLSALARVFPFRALLVADTRAGAPLFRVFSALDEERAVGHPVVLRALSEARSRFGDWLAGAEPRIEYHQLDFLESPDQESRPVAVGVDSQDLGGVVQCTTREITDSELQVLAPLLQTLAVAIHVSDRLHGAVDELKHLSHRDSLTGLFNRRSFEEFLHYEVGRVGEKTSGFAVIMGDLDHFKSINDAYGHQVGDEVIAFT